MPKLTRLPSSSVINSISTCLERVKTEDAEEGTGKSELKILSELEQAVTCSGPVELRTSHSTSATGLTNRRTIRNQTALFKLKEWYTSVWSTWQRRLLLCGLTRRCSKSQLEYLASALEPVMHRDYMMDMDGTYPLRFIGRGRKPLACATSISLTHLAQASHSKTSKHGATTINSKSTPAGLHDKPTGESSNGHHVSSIITETSKTHLLTVNSRPTRRKSPSPAQKLARQASKVRHLVSGSQEARNEDERLSLISRTAHTRWSKRNTFQILANSKSLLSTSTKGSEPVMSEYEWRDILIQALGVWTGDFCRKKPFSACTEHKHLNESRSESSVNGTPSRETEIIKSSGIMLDENGKSLTSTQLKKLKLRFKHQLNEIWQWMDSLAIWEKGDAISALLQVSDHSDLRFFATCLMERLNDSFHINSLSDSIIYKIFTYLPPRDLDSAAATCKRWHFLAQKEDLWIGMLQTLGYKTQFTKIPAFVRQLMLENAETFQDATAETGALFTESERAISIDWRKAYYDVAMAIFYAKQDQGESSEVDQSEESMTLAKAIQLVGLPILHMDENVQDENCKKKKRNKILRKPNDDKAEMGLRVLPVLCEDEQLMENKVPADNRAASPVESSISGSGRRRSWKLNVLAGDDKKTLRTLPKKRERPINTAQAKEDLNLQLYTRLRDSDSYAQEIQTDFEKKEEAEVMSFLTEKFVNSKRAIKLQVSSGEEKPAPREPSPFLASDVFSFERELSYLPKYSKMMLDTATAQADKLDQADGLPTKEGDESSRLKEPSALEGPQSEVSATDVQPKDTAAQSSASSVAEKTSVGDEEESSSEEETEVEGVVLSAGADKEPEKVARIGSDKGYLYLGVDIRPPLVQAPDQLKNFQSMYNAKWKYPQKENRFVSETYQNRLLRISEVKRLHGHMDSVVCITVDRRRIVSGSLDKSVRVWDIWSGTCLRKMYGHMGSISCVAITPHYIISGSWDMTIMVWDCVTYQLVSVLYGHTDTVSCLHINLFTTPHILSSAGHDGTVRQWHLNNFHCLRVIRAHHMPIIGMHISYMDEDEEGSLTVPLRLVTCSTDRTIRMFEISQKFDYQEKDREKSPETKVSIVKEFKGHTAPITCVCVSGQLMLSCSADGNILFWDISCSQPQATICAHNETVNGVIFQRRKFYTCSSDTTIKEWDLYTMTCLRVIHGHKGPVRSIIVNDKRIVSCSNDGTVRIWALIDPLETEVKKEEIVGDTLSPMEQGTHFKIIIS